MAQDMFIKIDGIEGESLDATHKNEIQVLAWHWSVAQHSNMHIRNALLRFEPRLIPQSLVVRPKRQKASGTTLPFEIAGLLYWQPEPLELMINGSYDTETDKTTLTAS